MWRNRIKLALRHLWREKGFTGINILGLALGLAAGLAIFMYAHYHYSFDAFHTHSDRIFRVLTIDKALGVSSSEVGITTPGAGPAALEQIPGVEAQVRILPQGNDLLQYGDQVIYSDNFAYADSNFFEFFSFPLLQGNASLILREPNTCLLSRTLANKLARDSNLVGQQIQSSSNETPLLVQGIFEDLPNNSHLDVDMIVAIMPEPSDSNLAQFLSTWNSIAAPTYVRLSDPADRQKITEQLLEIGRANDYSDNFDLTMQPLLETHLYSTELLFDNHNTRKTDVRQIKNMMLVAIFLLTIAAFNFMNLSTARSGRRAREIGMRKVLGAGRSQLMMQFLLESILLVTVALFVALAFLELFGDQMGIQVPVGYINYFLENNIWWGYAFVLVICLGGLSGLYPAAVLSSYEPIQTLKGNVSAQSSGKWLRRGLVTIQFAISVAVIIGMLIVRQQIQFMNEKDMGFNKEYVVTLPLNSNELYENASTLRDEVRKIENIEGVSFTGSLPGEGYGRTSLTPEGSPEEDHWIFSATQAEYDFAEVLNLEVVAGRFYNRDYSTDAEDALILNEAAVEAIGWEEAIGKTINFGSRERTVIGVVKNFHYVGLRYPIEPLIIFPMDQPGGTMVVKISADQSKETLARIESTWNQVNPNHPFVYSFFDDDFHEIFVEDERFAEVLSNFNWLAILIACMGLLGLTAYTVQQKTKELGIRKVLGADLKSILYLLSFEFWWILLAANLIAFPIAYFYMSNWLGEFVYRIDISPWPFLTAFAASFLVALLTILTQALRADRIHPVQALKYE